MRITMKRCLRSVIIITKLDADVEGASGYISMNVMSANALASVLAPEANSKARLFALWLCHVDARQVSDLPARIFCLSGSPTRAVAVIDRRSKGELPGKSDTCRASTW